MTKAIQKETMRYRVFKTIRNRPCTVGQVVARLGGDKLRGKPKNSLRVLVRYHLSRLAENGHVVQGAEGVYQVKEQANA